MNVEKMYLPDKDKWLRYYLSGIEGKNNTYINQLISTERGSFLIPIDKPSSVHSEKEDVVKLRLVSPSAQMVEMAKESLKEEGVNIKTTRKRKINHKKKARETSNNKKKKKKKDVFHDEK